MNTPSDHPVQQFSFVVIEEYSPEARALLDETVRPLGEQRSWVLGPPCLFEEGDGVETPDDEEILGGYLDIYSALRPIQLPREVDEAHLEEVTLLVDALTAYSLEHHLTVEFELDGTFVGSVTDGVQDKCLRIGLLEEWRKGLDGAPS